MGGDRGGCSKARRSMLASFRSNGFVRIDAWDGLNPDALERESRPILKHGGKVLDGTGKAQQLGDSGALKPLLDENGFLKRLARGYLGAHAEYHGLVLFRLVGSYKNTAWHHDGCGTRLKAFIYLTDVDEDTYPTQIMAGTHHMQWFTPPPK